MKTSVFIGCISLVLLSVILPSDSQHAHGDVRLDVFHELAEANNDQFSVADLQSFINEIGGHLECEDDHNHAHDEEECASLCVNATHLSTYVGVANAADTSSLLTEEEFHNATMVLLYYITLLTDNCHEEVDVLSLQFTDVTTRLNTLGEAENDGGHEHIPSTGLQALLDGYVKPYISHENHDHGDHEDHDDHDHENDFASEILEENCLASDAVMYYMSADEVNEVDTDQWADMAAVALYLLHSEADIEDSCRKIPVKEAFIENLWAEYVGATTGNLTEEQLLTMMEDMGISNEADSHAGHNHRRRRRSVPAVSAEGSQFEPLLGRFSRDASVEGRVKRGASSSALSRVKRQTTSTSYTQCYTAGQIIALYEAQSGVNQATFQQLCPILISQTIYADCSEAAADSTITVAEKYGYGTLAVLLICLTSIAGIFFLSFAKHELYKVIMSSMMGLAVGTLFADAVLHLIPAALGVHDHGSHEGHDHGSGEIVVEDFVIYGMILITGLYLFYVIETIMNRIGGLTHSHSVEQEVNVVQDINPNGSQAFERKNTSLSGKDNGHTNQAFVVDGPSNSQKDVENKGQEAKKNPEEKKGTPPLALMILIGDSIHNFADGLAIAASFSMSGSAGAATSIAIFCHELPHELGDFAVLLETGFSFKKAALYNLLSGTTAFLGLYVGLAISEDDLSRKWIFAIAAGMFIYISLVDVMPQLIKTQSILHLILNNVGMLVGIFIMFIISIYEEHIKV